MKIGITIPFYLNGDQDNEALKIAFHHYSKMGYTVHLCGSEKEVSKKFAEPFLNENTKYIEVKQVRFTTASAGDDHLRKKFNDSLSTLGGGFDWYCLVGANDIVPKSFFEELSAYNHKQVGMAGVGNGQPLYIREPNGFSYKVKLSYMVSLLPGVNAFTSAGIESVDWKPYQYSGCETGAEKLFDERGMVIQIPGHVVMIKGKYDLNSSQKIRKRHSCFDVTDEEKEMIESYVNQ